MQRRTFLAATATTALSASRALGANDRIRFAVIGAGGRGQLLLREFLKLDAEAVAVCDVYEPHLAAALKAAPGARRYDNYRRLLDDKNIDAVVIATPDHWHAQMLIDSVAAGKDVYIEKPLAHTVEEGDRMVKAVRRSRQIVQVGTQRRSYDLFQEAKAVVDSGALGEVRLVNAWWVNHQKSLRQAKIEGALDWQQWLGPAPKRPLDPLRFFNWYYFWDYSGGMMVGQAAHVIDAIHWLMNSTKPSAVTCAATRPNLEGAEVPETTTMLVEYPENYLAVFSVGYKAMRYHTYNDQCKQFHGSAARFDVGREWFSLYPQSNAVEMKSTVEQRRPGTFGPATTNHIRNFLDCMRSRKEPNATVEMGQATNIVLALAMQALRSGRRIEYKPNGS